VKIKHYEIHCATESVWKDWYLPEGDPEPTTCPTDSAHSITADSATFRESTGPDEILIKNEDGSIVHHPMTTKKTPIFQPSIIVPGDLFYGTGAFDEVTGSKKIGDGDLIKFDTSTPDDVVVVVGRFHHYVRIIGGTIRVWSSTVDDELSLEIVFPASAPASTPGTGNAVLASGVFIPIGTGDGDYTVDGSTLEAGHINQDLCPVPASVEGTGFWNWDPGANPSITPAPYMDGNYHLIPAEISALRQANRYPVANMDVTPAAGIQSKKVLPHWFWRFTLKKGPKTGVATEFRVLLYTSRITTK